MHPEGKLLDADFLEHGLTTGEYSSNRSNNLTTFARGKKTKGPHGPFFVQAKKSKSGAGDQCRCFVGVLLIRCDEVSTPFGLSLSKSANPSTGSGRADFKHLLAESIVPARPYRPASAQRSGKFWLRPARNALTAASDAVSLRPNIESAFGVALQASVSA
jgi:hypothetical protein